MDVTNAVINFRRHLKRKNYSLHTVRNYLNMLQHYIRWLDVPVEAVSYSHIGSYIDFYAEAKPTCGLASENESSYCKPV